MYKFIDVRVHAEKDLRIFEVLENGIHIEYVVDYNGDLTPFTSLDDANKHFELMAYIIE